MRWTVLVQGATMGSVLWGELATVLLCCQDLSIATPQGADQRGCWCFLLSDAIVVVHIVAQTDEPKAAVETTFLIFFYI